MEQGDKEFLFRRELLKLYKRNNRHFIPKEIYNQIIEDLKISAEQTSSKPRHGYYILNK